MNPTERLRAVHRNLLFARGRQWVTFKELPPGEIRQVEDHWLYLDEYNHLWKLRRTGDPSLPLLIEAEDRGDPNEPVMLPQH